jgi:hypothetical protein
MHGKPTITATSHHQQTNFPITNRARPRCKIRTVLKQREERKSCKEDGDSDIVANVLENEFEKM